MTDLELARKVLRNEAAAILALVDRVDGRFSGAVELLRDCRGRVILTGMGKSGIIARKVAATFTSTGTAAFFLHPAEAVHGDLGAVQGDDVVIALSHSGETGELLRLLETIRRIGARLIAMTGSPDSTLGRAADIVLDCGVGEEACPLNLAPTASTTAALAMGDALAMVLLVAKGFREEDFASLHPGGGIGKRLMRVESLMHTGVAVPVGAHDDADARGGGGDLGQGPRHDVRRRRGRPPGWHHHGWRPPAPHGHGRAAGAARVGGDDRGAPDHRALAAGRRSARHDGTAQDHLACRRGRRRHGSKACCTSTTSGARRCSDGKLRALSRRPRRAARRPRRRQGLGAVQAPGGPLDRPAPRAGISPLHPRAELDGGRPARPRDRRTRRGAAPAARRPRDRVDPRQSVPREGAGRPRHHDSPAAAPAAQTHAPGARVHPVVPGPRLQARRVRRPGARGLHRGAPLRTAEPLRADEPPETARGAAPVAAGA